MSETHDSLEELIKRTRTSMKDADLRMSQEYYTKFCALYNELLFSGSLNEKQIEHYVLENERLSKDLEYFMYEYQEQFQG